MDIPSYHLNFVNEEYDENGILKKFSIKYPDNFNFAYDITVLVDDVVSKVKISG